MYKVENQIRKVQGRIIELVSGGYLVIDHTEAMTTIDVNTGQFFGNRSFEQTVVKTNLEAALVIGRQLWFRNISGAIVIDFINMNLDDHENKVVQTLRASLDKDPVKSRVTGFNDIGLVVVSRKCTRESLPEILQENCISCRGSGKTLNFKAICNDIFRTILEKPLSDNAKLTTIIASPAIVQKSVEVESEALVKLEGIIHHPVRLKENATLAFERYEVVVS